MQVSMDLYLYHNPRSQLVLFFGPLPLKECNFTLIFVFIIVFSTAPYVDIWTIIHKTLYFSCMYLAYKCLRTCTYITCSQFHPLQHTHTHSWPLSENHFGLHSSGALTCEPLSRSIPCMYWYVWEPSAPSILCRWPLDLWTSVHRPNMGHRMCHYNRLTTLDFSLSSFLTP